MTGARGGLKRMLDLLELELQIQKAVNCSGDSGNQTRILCKGSTFNHGPSFSGLEFYVFSRRLWFGWFVDYTGRKTCHRAQGHNESKGWKCQEREKTRRTGSFIFCFALYCDLGDFYPMHSTLLEHEYIHTQTHTHIFINIYGIFVHSWKILCILSLTKSSNKQAKQLPYPNLKTQTKWINKINKKRIPMYYQGFH